MRRLLTLIPLVLGVLPALAAPPVVTVPAEVAGDVGAFVPIRTTVTDAKVVKFVALDGGLMPTPKHNTLDRIDNSKGYEPGNVRWATRAEQMRNTRRNVNLTHEGRTMCLKDWATELGINPVTLRYRVRNWGVQRAFTEPINHKCRGARK